MGAKLFGFAKTAFYDRHSPLTRSLTCWRVSFRQGFFDIAFIDVTLNLAGTFPASTLVMQQASSTNRK